MKHHKMINKLRSLYGAVAGRGFRLGVPSIEYTNLIHNKTLGNHLCTSLDTVEFLAGLYNKEPTYSEQYGIPLIDGAATIKSWKAAGFNKIYRNSQAQMHYFSFFLFEGMRDYFVLSEYIVKGHIEDTRLFKRFVHGLVDYKDYLPKRGKTWKVTVLRRIAYVLCLLEATDDSF